jgi:DNA invertase Pin-like site-specific DNA recombinase
VNTNKVTAIYARVSTSTGKQSTDSQLLEVKNHCKLRGWKNVEIYTDKVSGAKASRPALDKLVKDMRSGKIERVVAFKLDRIGRSLTHLCLLVDEMSNLGVPLICCSQGIDTSGNNPASKLQLDVLKAVCEFERNLIKDRVNAGLKAAVKRGVVLGRPSTLHQRLDEVMSLRKQGMGVRGIAKELKMPVASVYKLVTNAEKKK